MNTGLPEAHRRVDDAERVGEQRLVGHAPDVLEHDRLLREFGAVDDPVVVGVEVRVHVVEVAVPAVDEAGGVALVLEQLADGREVVVAGAAHDGLPGHRRRAERHRLEPAHRAGAGGVDVGEAEPVAGHAVEVGRQALRRTPGADELGRQALDHDQDDVARPAGKPGAVRLGGLVLERGRGLRAAVERLALDAEPAQDAVGLLLRDRGVEAVVVEFVAAHRRGEGEEAVGRELVGVGVADRAHLVDRRGGHRRQRNHDRRGGVGEAAAPRDGLRVGAPQPRPDRERDGQSRHRQAADDPGDRIRFADVADHLVRIEQVVDGDEVETRRELEPERGLGDGPEQQHEHAEREPGEAKRAMGAMGAPARGQQRFVQPDRRQQHRQHRKVEPQPLRQHGGPVGERHGIESGPQREADAGEREHRQRGERVEQGNAWIESMGGHAGNRRRGSGVAVADRRIDTPSPLQLCALGGTVVPARGRERSASIASTPAAPDSPAPRMARPPHSPCAGPASPTLVANGVVA